jgi:hypothetical protein
MTDCDSVVMGSNPIIYPFLYVFKKNIFFLKVLGEIGIHVRLKI